ncbi:hypothetical protein [Natrinema versiforme]|uniref:Uncharacterized protein n=1 Tax=Natrinema versiforme TaxID=88724 RepID=A0A4V1G028_9EURY|nr:hypothetical protein [Natrinema versiforme]QCS43896.1 hypothetical protein FEJ81_16650 [Natrinema versiforme]
MTSNDDCEERDYETDTINPSEDIDVAHDVDTIHIERMDADTLWLGLYQDEDGEPEHMYWILCDDDGLHIDRETHPDGM